VGILYWITGFRPTEILPAIQLMKKILTSSIKTTPYAERIPTRSAKCPNARGRARIAVPDASVARAPAWTVFSCAALIACERSKGYKLATPRPVRNRPLNPEGLLFSHALNHQVPARADQQNTKGKRREMKTADSVAQLEFLFEEGGDGTQHIEKITIESQ